MFWGSSSVSEILKGQIYLGNLSAASSLDVQERLGITHVVSVCPEYPSTGPKHLTIAVEDTEYDNILIHLPEACHFIQAALEARGRVLVHCVMGISRSATVVAAYLMKTRKMSRSAAMRLIKQKRPQVHPNYGFVKQLETFADCHYDISSDNPIYCQWKSQQKRNVAQYLNQIVDTVAIIPSQLLLSSEFPDDPCQAESLILDSGISHLLSITPAKIPSTVTASLREHRHIRLDGSRKEALLVSLPDTCKFIQNAIDSGGQVLVYSATESTACIVICAYLMFTKKISADEAYSKLESDLPLFNPTKLFNRHLELFETCLYHPTSDHPVVKDWVTSIIMPPPPSPLSANRPNISAIAKDVMSETSLDTKGFHDALTAIQLKNG